MITSPSTHPKELDAMETYQIRFPFGKPGGPVHGKKFTEIAQRDLRRIAQRGNKWGRTARRELKRRGTNYVDDPVEISFHAFDRISTEILDMFVDREDKDQGIKTWAVGLAADAIAWDNRDSKGRFCHLGLKFVFDFRPKVPVLVTILDNRGPDRKHEVKSICP